jgi:hypothetical protein
MVVLELFHVLVAELEQDWDWDWGWKWSFGGNQGLHTIYTSVVCMLTHLPLVGRPQVHNSGHGLVDDAHTMRLHLQNRGW